MDTINSFEGKEASAQRFRRGILLQPSNSSCWICDSFWNANWLCVCSGMKIHRVTCKIGDRKSRNLKMLISVEMQTGVYYKIWQHWKRCYKYGCRRELLQRLNVRITKRGGRLRAQRSPYWTWIYSTVLDTGNMLKHWGPSSMIRLYNTSMMEDHTAALICFIDRKATFLQQQWL